jgi:predicted metal-dependent phosphoesterase TrpH
MRADLHTHSDASDGTEPPDGLVRRAAAAGLDAVALTDHDTVAGIGPAARALPPGLALVPGMELSCRMNGRSVHLLAYLFDPAHPGLAEQTRRIRDDRVRRARAMVARLAGLGVPVTWEQVTAIAGAGVVGRPHIARAMAESGAIGSPAEAFTAQWIGDGGRAYVARYALEPARAIRLVREAGGVTVLAHPRCRPRVPARQIARLAAAGLAGVEVFHPDHGEPERSALLALAADLGLVATGGSDDHGTLTGHRIGAETTGGDAFARLVSQATGSGIVRR